MSNLREMNINFFPGFYESHLSWIIENEHEMFLEYEPEKLADNYGLPQTIIEQFLNDTDIFDKLFYWDNVVSWHDCYLAIAKDWVDSLSSIVDLTFNFKEMTSPRYYNFETDRVFVGIEFNLVQKMFNEVMEQREKLERILEKNHKSRDGFISFYSYDLTEWLEKPLEDWDCNELGSLFEAWLTIQGFNTDELEEEVLQSLYDNSYEYFDEGFNYGLYETKMKEALEEWEKEQKEKVDSDFSLNLFYRCSETLDTFTGR